MSASDTGNDAYHATTNMVIIAFFSLLQPGEYIDNDKDLFCLTDTQLFIGDTKLHLLTAPAKEIPWARFASLTFTSQKNGVREEVIELACSGDPYLCPMAIIHCLIYL